MSLGVLTPMRILFVTSKSLGGSGKHISALARALEARGLHCELTYFRLGVQQDDEIERSFAAVHPLPARPSLGIASTWSNIRCVRDLVRHGRFDWVHSHTSLGGLYGRVGGRLAGVPIHIGHTLHAFGADEFTPRPQKWLYWLIERGLDVMTDAYVAPSFYMAEYGRRTHVIGSTKTSVIHNALPLLARPISPEERMASRREFRVPDDHALILFCGRLEPQKGVDLLLHSLARTSKRSWTLVVCGTGKDESDLVGLANSLGIADRVRFLGWQSDLKRFYGAADLFAMPSRWESFGLVFLEAMHASLPIIATTTQAIPEVVVHDETGLLSPAEDVEALAQNLDRLIADAALRHRFGSAGNRRLERHFSFDEFVRSHIQWYEAKI